MTRHTTFALPISLGISLALASCGGGKGAQRPPDSPASQPASEAPPPQNIPKDAKVAQAQQGPAQPDPASQEWRATPPAPGAEPTPVLPSFKSATLDNGLTVIVSDQQSTLPIVSFSLVAKGGAALDPAAKAGVAALVYDMLGEGAGARDALQFSDAVADLGATFGSASDRDRGTVSIAGLSRNSDAMLALLADAVIRPKMADKDFARRKTQTIAALQRARGSPKGLAFEALPSLIYGPKHPYGHPPSGTVETVKRISLGDVRSMKGRVLAPQLSAIVASGAITLDEAVELAKKHFGEWKQPAAKAPKIPPVDARIRKGIMFLDKAAAPQTVVILGRPLFGRGHPDEHALTLANAVYGGEFTARLNMNLREDKGYSYGAYSQAAYRMDVGVFFAMSEIRQDATAAGLTEMLKEMEGMKTRPPTEEEVELAKAGIIRGLPGAFERSTAIASAGASIFLYGLPLDYYVHLAERYEKVTLEEVRAAGAKYLVPETMQILLVGDAKAVGDEVQKLDLGKVVVRDKPAS